MNFPHLRAVLAALSCLVAASCVSLSDLPQSAAEVDFDDGASGDTGWAEWQSGLVVRAESDDAMAEAAAYALTTHGYEVARTDLEGGAVMGEHGMTDHDWNIVAGIYFLRAEDGLYRVRIIVEGSKDFGITGDATSGDSPRLIAHTLRVRLDSMDT